MIEPLLRFEAVSKSYERGVRTLRVLRSVSFEVNEGELFGIYGQRGAGKSTLLRLAAGFEQPDEGSVIFAGTDLSTLSRGKRAKIHRASIAWVDRDGPQARDLPILDHVALPLYGRCRPAQARRRALVVLERVGASDAAEETWDRLSDTSRTLVATAHALVREPRLLLVDDPTGGLNVVDRERIVGLLRAAAEEHGCGVLMVVPDFPSMHHSHEIRALSRGRLVVPAARPRHDDGPGGTVVEFPRGERSA